MWFPDWSLGAPGTPSGEPVMVVGEAGRVVAASAQARLTGVDLGMPRRQAEMTAPGAKVLSRDVAEEWQRFEAVVAAIEEIVPKVEVVEPGLAFVPLAGAIRYYGGEETLIEILSSKLELHGPRLGVADGPFAASWAARESSAGSPNIVYDTKQFLADLDVAALTGESPDAEHLVATFRWLGVTTLGALAQLPREALASRFGASGLVMHRLAHGEDRMLDPRDIPVELAVEAVYEDPLENLDQAGFAARATAARLMNGLHGRGLAPHRVVIEMESARGEIRNRVWRSLDPFTENALADRIWWQLRAWLEAGQIQGGITRLKLDPSDTSGSGRQLAFFEDVGARLEAERALARAQALLEPNSVRQAVPKGGRMPDEQVVWYRWGEPPPPRDLEAPWPGRTPRPTPSLIPPRPHPLEIEWDEGHPVRIRLGSRWEPVINWSGPWRLVRKWWAGEQPVDRYQLVTSAGAFLCLVDGDGARLVGVYD